MHEGQRIHSNYVERRWNDDDSLAFRVLNIMAVSRNFFFFSTTRAAETKIRHLYVVFRTKRQPNWIPKREERKKQKTVSLTTSMYMTLLMIFFKKVPSTPHIKLMVIRDNGISPWGRSGVDHNLAKPDEYDGWRLKPQGIHCIFINFFGILFW